jgi:hypothetical protein
MTCGNDTSRKPHVGSAARCAERLLGFGARLLALGFRLIVCLAGETNTASRSSQAPRVFESPKPKAERPEPTVNLKNPVRADCRMLAQLEPWTPRHELQVGAIVERVGGRPWQLVCDPRENPRRQPRNPDRRTRLRADAAAADTSSPLSARTVKTSSIAGANFTVAGRREARSTPRAPVVRRR